jgi:hypothetical protein
LCQRAVKIVAAAMFVLSGAMADEYQMHCPSFTPSPYAPLEGEGKDDGMQ